jgi:nucleotide-binding universal stress UspA family protein
MNSFGKILVHLDDSLECDRRLDLAQQVANIGSDSGATSSVVEAVYASTPSYLASTMAYGEYSAVTFSILIEADEKRRNQAKLRFDAWAEKSDGYASWNAEIMEMPGYSLLRHSWLADLLVLGQYNASDSGMHTIPKNLIASLVMDSGKPALILPFIGSLKSTLQNVMIAWKPTRESANALSASLPFLQNAKSIHLVADVQQDVSEEFRGRFEAYLRANGILIKPSFQSSYGISAGGEELLSRSVDLGADLLVMGCYGHSRAREFVLGGASRTILESMTLPILMAH